MDLDVLRPFVRLHVEILVGGVWLEGLLLPIAKSVVVLQPTKTASAFYGPASCKAEAIQAIRQVKVQPVNEPVEANKPSADVRSSLESVTPEQRFKRAK